MTLALKIALTFGLKINIGLTGLKYIVKGAAASDSAVCFKLTSNCDTFILVLILVTNGYTVLIRCLHLAIVSFILNILGLDLS